MKVLSKIKRRNNGDDLPKRGHYVEMELFDTDRNPLEFPTADPPPLVSRFGSWNPGSGASPPWLPFGVGGVWRYRIGLLTYDPDNYYVEAATEATDARALKLTKSGLFAVQMKAGMNFSWSGASSSDWQYPIRLGLHIFKYSANDPEQTIAIDVQNFLYDASVGAYNFVFDAVGLAELDTGDEIGAELFIGASTGPPAGGDPWFVYEAGDLAPYNMPFQSTITRLGDHGGAVLIGV